MSICARMAARYWLQRSGRLLVAAKSRADGDQAVAADERDVVGACRSLLGDT